ncbi:MAG: hypothetical protein DRG50_01195 [Deltaproteobacteria bacterium]|nr:MAG: hypothetical protein DRG50_01195 [Deltaproteobacteria bacterium]
MFIRLLFLSIAIFSALFIYISYLNPLSIRFQYLKDSYLETSLSILLISSFFLGALITFFIYLVKDISRAFRERREKKEREQLWERFYLATDALLKGNLSKAEKHILVYLKKRFDDPKAYLKLAEIYQKGGRHQEAIETLRKAKGLKVDQLEILFREAQIYKEMHDYSGATKALEEIIALSPTNLEAMRQLRDIYIDEREWDRALKLQGKIIKRSPDEEIEQERRLQQGLKYECARLDAERGEEEKGIKELKEIIKEDRSFTPPQVLLGELLYKTGETKEAIKVWQKGFEETHEIIFLNKLEDLFLSQEDPRGIIHLYLEAMEKNPNNVVIPFFYARLCLRLEMIDEALQRLKEMELSLSDHPSYHYLLAEVYAHRADYEQAAGEYRKGLELEGGDYIPYRCTSCQKEAKEWLPFCSRCGQWGTYTVCTQEEIKAPLSPLPSKLMSWDF